VDARAAAAGKHLRRPLPLGDRQYPVDGGVFDVPKADGDVVVRIDPRLPVSRATAFAVTVEEPGGVVVSSRDRLPLLAAVP
jgi:hypothetical protein